MYCCWTSCSPSRSLSFLSLTIVWFLSLSRGRILGAELACVFTIFTGQAWNMALQLLPGPCAPCRRKLAEAGRMFDELSAWARFWRIEAPFATTVPDLEHDR